MSTEFNPRRLLLVEDDSLLGHGLVEALKGEGYEVDWVVDARAANAAIDHVAYDLAVLDLRLREGSGLDVLSRLRNNGNAMLVLIITGKSNLHDRLKGLDAGADDYVVKPFDFPELAARLRALLRRRYGGQNITLSHGSVTVDPIARTVIHDSELHEIPGREFDLLLLLLSNLGRILTRDAIESHSRATNREAESNTIEVYVHKLRKRFGATLIRTVRGVGYIIDKPHSTTPVDQRRLP